MRRYFSATLGNLLKHYDQAIYSCLIPFLAPLFFPHEDPVYSLLAAYALLPLGLIAKPLGAYVFGKMGDKWGRKITLSVSLLGMGLSTGGIGCLPSFEEVGVLAPCLLTFLRLLQNFFAAGETVGGALFLLEQTPKERRGFVSSLFDASGMLGIFAAALGVSFLGKAYWRELFWLGAFSGVIGLILRKKISEQKVFIAQEKWTPSDWKAMASIAAVSGFSYANYYLLSTFLNGFLPLVSRVSLEEALSLQSFLLAVDFFLLPCFGWLSLKISKEKLIFTATVFGAILSYPLFLCLDGAGVWIAGAVRIAFTVIGVLLAAPYYAWAMERTSEAKRFRICSMGSAIGSKLIGSPVPVIGLWLYHQTGWVASPALPLIFSALLASFALLYLKESRSAELATKS